MVTSGFWQFLMQQHRRDDPVGDFARDALADKTFPRRAYRHRSLVKYLKPRASEKAMAAFERVYDEWVTSNS